MKKLLSLAIFSLVLFTCTSIMAQVGIGTITPDGNAQLDISSPDKGLLIPRITEAARVGMGASATNGLLVYQTDVSTGFYFRQNDVWVKLNTGGSAIIPYATGSPINLTVNSISNAGLISIALVGFGNETLVTGVTPGNNINLNSSFSNFAFLMPRAGVIQSVSAYFNSVAAVLLSFDKTFTMTAQLYSSTSGNQFSPIANAKVTLNVGNPVSLGSEYKGITTGLNIPVAAGTRLLMVYSFVAQPSAEISYIITGNASGGVSIGGQ